MTIARKQAMTAYAFLLVPLSFFLFVRSFPCCTPW
jgi:hypothetical protein